MLSLTEFLVFAATFLISIVVLRSKNGQKKDGRRYPPSFPRLPIVGSLPFIEDFINVSEFFMKKGAELGPVFTLKFGSRFVVILNNLEAIQDAFVRHASSFSGREGFYIERNILNKKQKGIIFKDYHAEFRRYRRLSLSIMREFGFGSRSKLETLISTEVARLVEYFNKKNGQPLDPKQVISISAANVPHKMLLGRRNNIEDELNEFFVQIKRYALSINPALDFFPILRFFPPHSAKLSDSLDSNSKVMAILQHEIKRITEDETCDCFIRRYIEREGPDYDYEQLIYTMRDLAGASTETTSTAILWLFIHLANNPQVAERMQKEIDSVVPRDRLPTSDEQAMMPYTEATILESMRFRTPVPMAIPHLTMNDTEVLGYFIPANTVVIPNIKSAHLNKTDWPDGDVFRPERFLDENNALTDTSRVISFSLGRRSCPGESLARRQLFLFISGLVQNFSFRPPEGMDKVINQLCCSVVDCPMPFTIRLIPRVH